MDRHLIFLDIDGTLCINGKVTEKDLHSLEEARKAGNMIFINTGRSYGYIPEEVKKLPIDGFVCGLGTYVRLGNSVLRSSTLDKSIAKEVAGYVLEREIKTFFECEDGIISVNCDAHIELKSSDEIYTKFRDFRISKCTFFGAISDETREFLNKYFTVYEYETYSETVKKGYSKAKGMKVLGEYLNVPTERMMAVGDSENDADMISYAGIGVAMGNAQMSLKKKAKYITASVKESGVSAAIQKYILGR